MQNDIAIVLHRLNKKYEKIRSTIEKRHPIGIFDSGIGGLTVARAIKEIMPMESIIYLGDLAHLPYGTKSKNAVISFSLANIEFLIGFRVKLIVVACNTASSVALPFIKKKLPTIPLIGVVTPGARSGVEKTRNKRIGVIGTSRTIESKSYIRAIKRYNKDIEVYQRACPLLVPLIEEGFINHPATKMIIREYMDAFLEKDIDTLILGCTHYPLIKKQIKEIYPDWSLVDSSQATAMDVRSYLKENNMLNENRASIDKYYFTDITKEFKKISHTIMGKRLNIKIIKVKEHIE